MNPEALNFLQQRYGSALWNKWEPRRWVYYDYVRYDVAGVSELNFFANARGATDPVSNNSKTDEETNLTKSRTIGQQYFLVHQIRTHIHILPHGRQASGISSDVDVIYSAISDVIDEIHQMSYQGVLDFDIQDKSYFTIEQPFRYCPPGFGVNIINWASSNDGAEARWWQQCPYAGDVYTLTPPQMIEPEVSFECKIKFPEQNSPAMSTAVNSTDPRINIGVLLDGYLLRPLQ